MKVTIVQMDIVWNEPSVNIQRLETLIGNIENTDLIVLPEMWPTGFVLDDRLSVDNEGDSAALAWMKDLSKRKNCAVCGSMAVRDTDGLSYNRFYFVTPNGLDYYNKRHLFTPGGEQNVFTAGGIHKVVEWKGFRFLLLTCYDLRFPVWSRYGIAGEYDAIIYTANWPSSRQQAWNVLLRARAIENQCYVIAANRVGDAPKCKYMGGSMVVDPLGNVLQFNENAETLLKATLCIEELQKSRCRFRVLSDRDNYPIV